MKTPFNYLIIPALALMLGACGGMDSMKTASEPEVSEPAKVTPPAASRATTSAVSNLGYINGIRIDRENSPDSIRTVYFEYDSSEVRTEFIPIVAAHAELLASDSSKRVVLEGHADERGSREYNVALGERRAISVRRLLLSSGARDSQIRTISYGEERPAAVGQNENAWSKNRRVKIRYE